MDMLTDTANLPSKALLAEIDAFFNAHYKYCQPEYCGFFGRFRAIRDAREEEESARRYEAYRLVLPQESLAEKAARQQADAEPIVFGSCPPCPDEQQRIDRERSEDLKKRIETLKKETFSFELFRFIDAKGKDPVDIYKRANIDRKLFSKIRGNDEYIPSKKTAISLAIALELSLDETRIFLGRAGYTLSSGIISDVIIEYFISHGKYDIDEINSILLAYKRSPLGYR